MRVADHPSQRSRIHRLARAGELVRVLPGTLRAGLGRHRPAHPARRSVCLGSARLPVGRGRLWTRRRAASTRSDGARRSSSPVLPRHPQPGIHWYAADVPDRFVTSVGGLRFARPLVAAAALAATDGGVAIDRLLMREPAAGEDLAAVARLVRGESRQRRQAPRARRGAPTSLVRARARAAPAAPAGSHRGLAGQRRGRYSAGHVCRRRAVRRPAPGARGGLVGVPRARRRPSSSTVDGRTGWRSPATASCGSQPP